MSRWYRAISAALKAMNRSPSSWPPSKPGVAAALIDVRRVFAEKRNRCAGGSIHTELSMSLDFAARARRSVIVSALSTAWACEAICFIVFLMFFDCLSFAMVPV